MPAHRSRGTTRARPRRPAPKACASYRQLPRRRPIDHARGIVAAVPFQDADRSLFVLGIASTDPEEQTATGKLFFYSLQCLRSMKRSSTSRARRPRCLPPRLLLSQLPLCADAAMAPSGRDGSNVDKDGGDPAFGIAMDSVEGVGRSGRPARPPAPGRTCSCARASPPQLVDWRESSNPPHRIPN